MRVFWKLGDDGAGQFRQIARGGDLARIRQAVGVGKAGARHAEFARRIVHFLDEGGFAASNRFGQHHGDVVGGFDHQRLQRHIDGQFAADRQADLAWRLQRRDERTGDFVIELQLALLDRVEGQISRHDFRQRGWMPQIIGVFGIEDLAVRGLKKQCWTSRGRAVITPREGQSDRHNRVAKDCRNGPHAISSSSNSRPDTTFAANTAIAGSRLLMKACECCSRACLWCAWRQCVAASCGGT